MIWALALLAPALAATACGFSLRGSDVIDIDGSSTVFPITEAVVEEFGNTTGGSVRVVIGVSGTGGGFKTFCNRETDISNASRPVKAVEVERCVEEGVEFIEIPVAIDGLTVVVNLDNDFVQCMTTEELHIMWAPEAQGEIKRWNQVRPGWPDKSFQLFGPGVDSGTFDFFTKVVNGKAQDSRGDYIANERDEVLIAGVAGDKNGLAYFGFPFFKENSDILKAVAIDDGNGCVTPSEETINAGEYTPLSRPLFVYVRKESAEDPMVQDLVRFHLSDLGQQLVTEVGYVPYPVRVYDLALDRFESGLTGTLFGGSNPQEGSVEQVLSANR